MGLESNPLNAMGPQATHPFYSMRREHMVAALNTAGGLAMGMISAQLFKGSKATLLALKNVFFRWALFPCFPRGPHQWRKALMTRVDNSMREGP